MEEGSRLHIKNSDEVQIRTEEYKAGGGHRHSDNEGLVRGVVAYFLGLF